ncbi:MAG: chorismate mutase [Acidobacteriota bacterium]
MTDPLADIRSLRALIDAVDDRLVELLNRRADYALRIGGMKRRAGLPIYAPQREAEVLDRVSTRAGGRLSPAALRRLFERIIDESRRLERSAAPAEPGAGPGRGEPS